jgi:hypothetical protein
MTTMSPPPSGADKARMVRRAQAVARLRHPNLVRTLQLPGGAGLSPVLGNARRLADFTLPAGTFKRFDLEQVVRLLLDVLSGLAALHEVTTDGQSFVHGEVSPQNIYVDEHGTARLVPLMSSHLSTGAKLESTGYVSPERLLGKAVDARADVFSVGVMLWEALAGKRLFPDPSLEAVTAHARERKTSPIALGPRVRWAAPLCAIAERAIAMDPGARYGSALELSNAIAVAAAQQLSRVDTDAWQEEAPTPVFQPRVHLQTLRIATPPPSVIDLAREAARVEQPRELPPPAEASSEPLEDWQRGRRGRGGFLVVAGLLTIGAWAGWRHAPGHWRDVVTSRVAAARAPAPSRMVELPSLAPPVAALRASAPPPPKVIVAPPVASATTATSASATPPVEPATSAAPRPRSKPPAKLKRAAGAPVDDYGI